MTPQERILALQVARDALEATVVGRAAQPLPGERRPPLSDLGACFVTLRAPGHTLRGCLGSLEARRALGSEIRAMTAASATRDPRFLPVQPAEVPHLVISLSVLGPMERIGDPSQLRVGRHGLMIRQGAHQGVLLPQVAVEQGWDAERFLRETCRKAGLPPHAGLHPTTELHVFAAEVFGEDGA